MQDNIIKKKTVSITQDKALKQKAFAKVNGTKALCKQTALNKAVNSIKQASIIHSIIYNSIKKMHDS